MIGVQLRVALGLTCTVCLQVRFCDDTNDTPTEVALFGVVDRYRVCPCCHREIGNHTDEDYRRRVRVWLYEQEGVVLRDES